MFGFKWIINNTIAGAPQPGVYADLCDDLAYIKKRNIDYILTLTEDPLRGIDQFASAISYLHLPIGSMNVPPPSTAYPVMLEMKKKIDEGHRFLIHCNGGLGCTGMIAAAYLAMTDETPTNAINQVRSIDPFYIQTNTQELFVVHFCTYVYSLK